MIDALIRELAELDGGELHKALLQRRQEVVAGWTASDDDRRDLISKGEKRILDQLIGDIENAKNEVKKSRQGAERTLMSQAF